MVERSDEVDLKISLGFIGPSKKPVFADETISVKVPVNYTIGKVVNEILRRPSEVSSSTDNGSINTMRFLNRYVKRARSNKNAIRVILPRSNQPWPTAVSVKQAGLVNGDTLKVIVPKAFFASLPGKPMTQVSLPRKPMTQVSLPGKPITPVSPPRKRMTKKILQGKPEILPGKPVTPPREESQ